MKKLVIGILAHVDAGKTTLSEGMLYLSGRIGKPGRVDNQDAFLDHYELERARGITIFSKQAVFMNGETQITLLDTPGHVDFSAEMERTLPVLDYAILVISGADGVQGHTKTLWQLLRLYRIPVFLFINKMDQNGTDRDRLIAELKTQLDDGCIDIGQGSDGRSDFRQQDGRAESGQQDGRAESGQQDGRADFGAAESDHFYEQLALCDETMMESYLETGRIGTGLIQQAVRGRKVFPCYFGSALKMEGIEQLLSGIDAYTLIPDYPDEFGAKIYKITRDEQGNRLTHMKLTGGRLRVKDALFSGGREEKVNQIRIYSGLKYEAVNEAEAGSVCAVTGLSGTKSGEGLGTERSLGTPVLEPVLFYRMILPEGCDPRAILPKLRQLEEEEPELHIAWDEQLQEIQVQIMGEVQIEILQSMIHSRYDLSVAFGEGRIVYKETIAAPVEGVGHFEPLRHYAEVHLLLEPGEPGSGLRFASACSEDLLGRNWQRLVLTHLEEKAHKGVLTGSAITDLNITLVSGRAHNKHTEGGDFREATYRAVRQGLKEAESVLLEPFYSFQLELPEQMVGRAMTDIERMHGISEIVQSDGQQAVLKGSAPVVSMRNYQKEVAAYTKGLGRLFCVLEGYRPCHNAEEVIQRVGYDSERDEGNPTGSVFCANGAGYPVRWDEVKNFMHVERFLREQSASDDPDAAAQTSYAGERQISQEEIEKIINKTFYANQGKKSVWKRRIAASEKHFTDFTGTSISSHGGLKEIKENYLLVDGYNIIHAWPELKELADGNMEGARMKLIDALSDYQVIRRCSVIVVFDAYRVQGHREETMDMHNIHLVFTKEAQTADQYIEKFAHDNKRKYQITVATSDGLQQMIIRGSGCSLLSARELKLDLEETKGKIRQEFQEVQESSRNYLIDSLSPETKQRIEALRKEED